MAPVNKQAVGLRSVLGMCTLWGKKKLRAFVGKFSILSVLFGRFALKFNF